MELFPIIEGGNAHIDSGSCIEFGRASRELSFASNDGNQAGEPALTEATRSWDMYKSFLKKNHKEPKSCSRRGEFSWHDS